MFTIINIYTSGIYHKSNGYYYVVMVTGAIFCLQQGWYEPTKAYYQRFEAAISTSELEKMHGYDKNGTQQDLREGILLQHHQEISGDVPPYFSQLWTIIRDLLQL